MMLRPISACLSPKYAIAKRRPMQPKEKKRMVSFSNMRHLGQNESNASEGSEDSREEALVRILVTRIINTINPSHTENRYRQSMGMPNNKVFRLNKVRMGQLNSTQPRRNKPINRPVLDLSSIMGIRYWEVTSLFYQITSINFEVDIVPCNL